MNPTAKGQREIGAVVHHERYSGLVACGCDLLAGAQEGGGFDFLFPKLKEIYSGGGEVRHEVGQLCIADARAGDEVEPCACEPTHKAMTSGPPSPAGESGSDPASFSNVFIRSAMAVSIAGTRSSAIDTNT